jgi:PAS domain S-box-containing protein
MLRLERRAKQECGRSRLKEMDRKRLDDERELPASEAKYRTLFDSIDEGFVISELLFDEEGKPYDLLVLETNASFERLMQTPTSSVGKRAREIFPTVEASWFEMYGRVVETGESMRSENYLAALDRWFNMYLSRLGEAGRHRLAIVFNDITERKRQEANLALLAEVGMALASLTNIDETMSALGERICKHFGAVLCAFSDIDETEEIIEITHEWKLPELPSWKGVYRVREHYTEDFIQAMHAGEAYIVRDAQADARPNAQNMAAIGIRSFVSVPLLRNGRWRYHLCVADTAPRNWRDDEIELMRELVMRIWTRVERARVEENLRRSEERLRLILESAQGFAIFTTDAEGTINSWYEGARQVFGWSEAEILGQKCNVTFTPEDRAAGAPEQERETARREGIAPDIRWHQRKDGSRVFINGVMHLLRDGQRNGFFKMGRDETVQRQAEVALRRSEERLRLILESAKGYAIFTTDADGLINSWNPGAAHTFGWSEAEILGQSIDLLFTPEDRAMGAPQKELETARAEGMAPDIRWHQRKDGSRVFINGAVHPLRDGQLHGFVKIGRDMTEQRQAEEAVREHQKQLQFLNETLEHKVEQKTAEVRQLASDVINATQQERQRLSRVLHDDLQQRAYALLMQLSFLRDQLPAENHSARKDASAIEKELAEIVKITRHLSIDLSPPILPGEGLSHAIEWLASRMQEQYGLPVELQANGPFVIPDENLHVFLFNCVRELLFNVVKHAKASRAVVALAWLDNGVQIEVRDDGKGFPDKVSEEGKASMQNDLPRSLGLPTIRHQLSLFGGVMEINSKPGAGTQVILTLPVAEASQGVSSSTNRL